jgi:ABC-type transporter Mla MlaB component
MPLRITQMECSSNLAELKRGNNDQPCDSETDATVLKVEGCLYLEDAELLERICRDIGNQNKRHLKLNLADISFVDSESASVLCRLKREQGVTLDGLQLFIAKVVELAEAEASVSKYFPASDEHC